MSNSDWRCGGDRNLGLEPIQRRRIYEEIIEQLERLIREGDYQPGDRLPPERELAKIFSVSRAAVREAMSALAATGLLEIRQGSGIYLRRVPDHAYLKPISSLLFLEREAAALIEFMEVRRGLEVEAADLAAQRATPEEVAALNESYLAMEKAIQAGELAVDEDYAFHYAIAVATHNQAYVNVMNTIADLFRLGLKHSKAQSLHMPGRPLVALEEHEKILTAIKKHDRRAARAAMRLHLANVERKIRLGLERGKENG